MSVAFHSRDELRQTAASNAFRCHFEPIPLLFCDFLPPGVQERPPPRPYELAHDLAHAYDLGHAYDVAQEQPPLWAQQPQPLWAQQPQPQWAQQLVPQEQAAAGRPYSPPPARADVLTIRHEGLPEWVRGEPPPRGDMGADSSLVWPSVPQQPAAPPSSLASGALEDSSAASAEASALAARLVAAEAQIAALRVELAVANEKAESYKALALAKDDIIASARKQTSEWRKHAGDVLKASTATSAAALGGGGAKAADKDKKKK